MKCRNLLIATAVTTALAATAAQAARIEDPSAELNARHLISANAGKMFVAADDQFAARNVVTDVDGTEHVRFTRTYKSLPVIGGDFVVHSRNGRLLSVSQTMSSKLRPSMAANLSVEDAIIAAGTAFGTGFKGMPYASQVVYARDVAPTLAYEVVMKGQKADQTPTEMHYFVDAKSGAILDQWDMVHTAAANGTGKTISVGDVSITTNSVSGGYELVDPSRGNGATYDGRNVSYTSAATGATLFTDADNVWGNNTNSDRASAAAEAHYGVALTWDYYKNTHGRNGIFNDGKGVKSYVHVGSNWVNAAWYNNAMYYGDGDGTTYRPLTTLDIAGHEMSHGVTQAVSGLAYSKDAGGLNESTSDIFGTMVEFYANNANDPGDWLIGEEIYVSNASGTKAMRLMFKQNADGRSYVCYPSRGFGTKPADDPHYTSGVGNRFFYLLSQGAVVPAGFSYTPADLVCNGDTGVTGIGRAKAEKIWYRALDVYFTSSTNYPGARAATLKAATDLYGASSPEYAAVARAWSAVAVN